MKRKVIPANIDCHINNCFFQMTGLIDITPGGGLCSAEITFGETVEDFQPEVLSFMTITGYPDASFGIGKASNPFNSQKANFKTNRKLDLGVNGSLVANYESRNRGTAQESLHFIVSGTVNLPNRIVSLLPTVESWKPIDASAFLGQMTFCWGLSNGHVLTGYAESVYSLENAPTLLKEQMRMISFSLESSPSKFLQKEVIKLHEVDEWTADVAQNLITA